MQRDDISTVGDMHVIHFTAGAKKFHEVFTGTGPKYTQKVFI